MNDAPAIFSNFISILSIGVSLLLSFLCLTNIQGVNKSGNRWLGVFMLCIFFLYIDDNLIISGMTMENPIIVILLNMSVCLFAPAFYYTVSYFITPDSTWKIKDYFHLFWLLLLYFLYSSYLLYKEPSQGKNGMALLMELTSGSFGILLYLQIFCYCMFSWIKLKKHEINIRLFTSAIENVDLKWLKYVVICVLIMASIFIIGTAIISFLNINDFYQYYIFELPYLTGFFSIAFFSMKQKEIYPFTKLQKNEILHTIIEDTSKKQEPKKLIEDYKLEELKSALLHIMENEKPFLDSELTLVKLAAMMDISLHQLSYLINTGFNENFYQFVNRYRIEEAKKLILDKKMSHLNFQGIAFEVGFNSKSVFNSTFKKCTGQTPSEYKTVGQYETVVATSPDY
ncbi:MAG TPA: helix-turn-helix domain-containing protein [Flavobacterium sp.]